MSILARNGILFLIIALCGLLCGCSSDKKQQHMKRADVFLAEGKIREAVIELVNAFNLDKSDRVVGRKLGFALFELGDYRSAIRLLGPLHELSPGDPELTQKVALTYFALGDYPKAEPLLVEAIGHYPDDAALKLKLGVLFLATRRRADARQTADNVLQKEADNKDALLLLPKASVSTNDMQDAIDRLKAKEDIFSDSPMDEITIGNLHLRSGRNDAAEKAFRSATERHPDSDRAHLALGEYLLRSGKAAEAREEYRRAAELATPTSGTRIRVAHFHIDQGDFDTAETILDEAIAANPKHVTALMAKAQLAWKRDDLDAAKTILDEAIAANAMHVPALIAKAELALKMRDPNTCITISEKVLEIDPDNVRAKLLRANAKLAGDRPQDAVKEFEELASVHKNALPILRGLALAYMMNGRAQDAIEVLEGVIAPLQEVLRRVVTAEREVQKCVVAAKQEVDPDAASRLAELYDAANRLAELCADDASQLPELYADTNRLTKLCADANKLADLCADTNRLAKLYADANRLAELYAADASRLPESVAAAKQEVLKCVVAAKQEVNPADVNRLEELCADAEKFAELCAVANELAELCADASRLAELYADAKRLAKLCAHASRLAELYPDDTIRLAELYIRTGQALKALPLLEPLKERLPDQERIRVLLAAAYGATESMDKAVAECRYIADELAPEKWTSYYRLGLALLADGQIEEASAAFFTAIGLSTNSTLALEQWINIELRAGRTSNAVAQVQTQIDKTPSNPDLWWLRGLTHLACKENESAIEALKKAVDKGTRRTSVYVVLARLYMAAGRDDDAVAELEDVLKKNPNQVELMMLLAAIHSQRGRPEEAARRYREILDIAPDFVPALNNLACLCQGLGKIEEALRYAVKAQKLAPRDPNVADTLGWIKLEQGDDLWALALLQEAVEGAGKHPEILYHLGMAQVAVGREAAALKSFELALEQDRDFTGMDEAKLWSSILVMRPDETNAPAMLAELQTIVATNQSNSAAWVRIGRIHALKGDNDSAQNAFQKAIDARKNYLPAMKGALKLHTRGAIQYPGALELAERALTLTPDDAVLMAYKGQLLYATGDYARALTFLEKAAQKRASDAELGVRLAHALYVAGRVTDAGNQLRLALKGELDATVRADAERFAQLLTTYAEPDKADRIPNHEGISVQDPDTLPLMMAAAAVLRAKGKTDQAAALLENIVKQYDAFPWAMLDLADIYAALGSRADRTGELAKRARRPLADIPSGPDPLYLLGRYQYHLDQHAEALATINSLLKQFPSYPHAPAVRKLVAELTKPKE